MLLRKTVTAIHVDKGDKTIWQHLESPFRRRPAPSGYNKRNMYRYSKGKGRVFI